MKKILSFAFVLVFSLVIFTGCGKKHYCDHCGKEATWISTDKYADMIIKEVGEDQNSYFCDDCKINVESEYKINFQKI